MDCEAWKTLDFTLEIFATVHLPVEYVEGASHPILDKSLGEVVNPEDIQRLQERFDNSTRGRMTRSNISHSDEYVESEICPEEILETVKRVFAGTSPAARERDNIERWSASENGIPVETAHTIIDKWVSEGKAILKGRRLEFPEKGGFTA